MRNLYSHALCDMGFSFLHRLAKSSKPLRVLLGLAIGDQLVKLDCMLEERSLPDKVEIGVNVFGNLDLMTVNLTWSEGPNHKQEGGVIIDRVSAKPFWV